MRLPRFPYQELMDRRPKRIMSRSRVVEIVDAASYLREKIARVEAPVDALDVLQYHFPEGANWIPDDQYFELRNGSMMDVPAFCDFADSITMLYIKESVWIALNSHDPIDPARIDANECIGHELGHIVLERFPINLHRIRRRRSSFRIPGA
ncbi:hypothetical protein P1J78_17565 [Psychromarinibacter sp. C21-152]|uniref:Uncharacterized protein n=1 Tax=Psychromarinibacter sediminicola TaxID=3033385 RepID=A0AAE3NX37_9RHOB|nr:hypothetical protein [Psychromarinibacter sediminicola]MDF0602550.1 hypothetical protein [Psychromarinibacter sediminicola]